MLYVRLLFALIILGFVFTPFPALPQKASSEGTLILNEISPFGSIKYVELLNPTDFPVEPAGWALSIDGHQIEFGADTPQCPAGGFIVLSYGNELPLIPESTILLQAQIDTTDNPVSGVVQLSDKDGPVDGVAWGFPGESESAPPNCLPRVVPPYELLPSESDIFSAGDIIFRLPNDVTPFNTGTNWAMRSMDESTPGIPNNFPGPWIMEPEDGARMASDFSLGVQGYEWADEIEFQVARDDAFNDILINEKKPDGFLFIATLTRGDYFWRARGIKDSIEHPWSPVQTFTREPFDIEDLLSGMTSKKTDENGNLIARVKGGGNGQATVKQGKWIGLTHQVQHKDTSMVCIDGSPMVGQFPWDTPHPDNAIGTFYNRVYCVRACLAIIAGQYGNKLSQDRISYYVFEEAGNLSQSAVTIGQPGTPYMDLGFNHGILLVDVSMALDWVYGQEFGNSLYLQNSTNVFENNTPDMDSIKDFIDNSRPIIRGYSGHAVIIDGYATIESGTDIIFVNNYIRVIDPWYFQGSGAISWRSFNYPTGALYFLPPKTGVPSRVDEPGVTQDSDGDGLVDFDEINRFNTDPNNPDTDGDDVRDKDDIRGYCFGPDGAYHRRDRDVDGDGNPKELDPDNDNANNITAHDGCEDTNKDGLVQGETETDPFIDYDDFSIINPDCFRGYLRRETIASRHDAEVDFEFHYLEELIIANGDPSSEEYIHPHRYEHFIDSVDSNGGTVHGEDSQHGLAKAKLEVDETTGEYFLITDTNTPNVPFTTIVTFAGLQQVFTSPFEYTIDNDARWSLGVPIEENGGLVLRGEWETAAGLNVEGPMFYKFEIWIEPPG